MASDHLPKVVKAEDLTVREGKLTWSSHGVSSEIDVGSLLFALKPPASAHQYIICGLQENNSESAATTFELVLLQTSSMPDQISSLHLVSQIPPHLRPSTDNLVDVVVSTKAGSGLALPFWQAVLHPLLRVAREELAQASPGTEAAELAGSQQESVLVTENAGSVPQFAQRLWASHSGQAHRDGGGKQSRTVILLSGDGGVVDILNSCEEDYDAQAPAASSPPQPLVCPLPLGTGNALFHSLHKPVASARPASSPLVLGLQTLFQGAPANLPTFRASFSAGSRVVAAAAEEQQQQAAADGGGATDTPPKLQEGGNNKPVSYLNGAVVASYGFHASIVHESDTPAYRAHGQKRFGMVAQELLRRSHPYTAQVEIRRPGAAAASLERVPRETHAYVLVTPLSNLERTFAISPDSRPLDGRLRAVHFGPIGGERIMDVMMKAYDGGKHVGLAWEEDGERVWYDEVEEIRLKALDADGRWRKVCIDGTIVELPVGGDVVVSKSNHTLLRVLAPKEVLPA